MQNNVKYVIAAFTIKLVKLANCVYLKLILFNYEINYLLLKKCTQIYPFRGYWPGAGSVIVASYFRKIKLMKYQYRYQFRFVESEISIFKTDDKIITVV